jgi:hypothetical protein
MTLQNDLALSEAEPHSAVSWGAVLAGAAAGLASAFVLVTLFAGFGLKATSPWLGAYGDPSAFSPTLGAAMVVIQVLSSALGGYLAGRLRTKWTHVHGHEVHFRDTAHGLLSWAVATLAGAAMAAILVGSFSDPTNHVDIMPGLPPSAADATQAAPAPVDPAAAHAQMIHEDNLASQASLFLGIGLLLGAFSSAVAAAIGGLRREDMHATYWREYHPTKTSLRE